MHAGFKYYVARALKPVLAWAAPEDPPVQPSAPPSPNAPATPREIVLEPDGKVHPSPPSSNDIAVADPNVICSKEAFKLDPLTGELIECDTDDTEAQLDMAAIMLPGSEFPKEARQFGVLFNRGVLEGWVKQPSPCCGAASIAGAVNCIRGVVRGTGEGGTSVASGTSDGENDRVLLYCCSPG